MCCRKATPHSIMIRPSQSMFAQKRTKKEQLVVNKCCNSLVHVGGGELQLPSESHTQMLAPFCTYPALHVYRASVPYSVEVNSAVPWAGLSGGPQSTPTSVTM